MSQRRKSSTPLSPPPQKRRASSVIAPSPSQSPSLSISQTESSQASQSPALVANISGEEREKLIGDLMRYMIFANYKKKPVDKNKMRSEVMKEYAKTHRALTNTIIEEAQKRFKDIFGFELVELPTISKSKSAKTAKATKPTSSEKYVLKNILDTQIRADILAVDSKNATELGLLGLILSIINLSDGGHVEESSLFALLERVGLNKNNVEHVQLGNWHLLIQQFVDQGYLHKDVKSVGNEKTTDYSFGARAQLEVDKKELRDFLESTRYSGSRQSGQQQQTSARETQSRRTVESDD